MVLNWYRSSRSQYWAKRKLCARQDLTIRYYRGRENSALACGRLLYIFLPISHCKADEVLCSFWKELWQGGDLMPLSSNFQIRYALQPESSHLNLDMLLLCEMSGTWCILNPLLVFRFETTEVQILLAWPISALPCEQADLWFDLQHHGNHGKVSCPRSIATLPLDRLLFQRWSL